GVISAKKVPPARPPFVFVGHLWVRWNIVWLVTRLCPRAVLIFGFDPPCANELSRLIVRAQPIPIIDSDKVTPVRPAFAAIEAIRRGRDVIRLLARLPPHPKLVLLPDPFRSNSIPRLFIRAKCVASIRARFQEVTPVRPSLALIELIRRSGDIRRS